MYNPCIFGGFWLFTVKNCLKMSLFKCIFMLNTLFYLIFQHNTDLHIGKTSFLTPTFGLTGWSHSRNMAKVGGGAPTKISRYLKLWIRCFWFFNPLSKNRIFVGKLNVKFFQTRHLIFAGCTLRERSCLWSPGTQSWAGTWPRQPDAGRARSASGVAATFPCASIRRLVYPCPDFRIKLRSPATDRYLSNNYECRSMTPTP